jgi:hypothetical protein
MVRRKNKERTAEIRRQGLVHTLTMAVLPAAMAAMVAGIIGYKLNTRMPELYYEVSPKYVPAHITGVSGGFKIDVNVMNLGNSPATEMTVRYAFNQEILAYDYSYSEGLNGKLPYENVSGGVGEKEVMLTPPRLSPKDKIEAYFVFGRPVINTQVKVFSKETQGKPLSERVEPLSYGAKLWNKIVQVFGSLF